MKRSGLLTAVCFFYWFSTLYLGAVGVILLALLFAPYLAGTLPPGQILQDMEAGDAFDLLLLVMLLVLVVMQVIFAILFAIIGWGLWKLKRWARPAAIVASGIQIALSMCDAFLTQAGGDVRVPWHLVLHGFALWVLFRKDTKAAFRPALSEGTETHQQADKPDSF